MLNIKLDSINSLIISYFLAVTFYFISSVSIASDIHEILILTGRFEGVNVNVWTSVGTDINNLCSYTKETDKVMWVIYKEKYLYLNSEKLKQMVGVGFTCAKTNVQIIGDKKIFDSPFQLILNDTKNEYIGSNPSNTNLLLK